MKRYEKYKEVDLPWLKELPEGWEINRVKRIFYISKDISYKDNPIVLSLARDKIKIRDIESNSGQLAENYSNYNTVKIGDLLLNPMDLYSGANCNISYYDGVISPAYINLRAKQDINLRYFDFLFKIQYTSLAFQSVGKGVSKDNRWTLSNETLLNYKIIVPSKKEQIQIASFLDWKTSEIDRLIELEKRKIEKLEEYRKSVFSAFIKNEKEYKSISLKNILKIKNIKKIQIDRDLNLLSVVRDKGIILRNFDEEDENHNVIPEDLSNYKVVSKNDFVMNKMKAWQGAYGISKLEGVVSPAYFIFEFKNKDILKDFFHLSIRCREYIDEFAKYSKGIRVGQWDFDLKEIKNIYFKYPNLDRQKYIIDKVKTIYKNIDEIISKTNNQITYLQELKQTLISDVVTGKIDVRDIEIPEKYRKEN